MNTKTTITFKTDKKLRDQAKKVASRLGIPLTTMLNARLAEFVREGHFEVSLTPRPEKIEQWSKEIAEYEAHPERFKVYRSAADLMKDITTARTSSKKKGLNARTSS